MLTSVRLTPDLVADLRHQAEVEDRSASAVIRQALRAYLTYHAPEPRRSPEVNRGV